MPHTLCLLRRQFYLAYKALYPTLKPCFYASAQPMTAVLGGFRNGGSEQVHAIVSPSILSADFANLAADVIRVAAAGAARVDASCCAHWVYAH